MGHLYKEGRADIRPNTRSFNTVINAWAKSGRGDEAAEKAQDLLDMMTRLYEEGNNDTVRPDVHTFCTVINGTYFVFCHRKNEKEKK
jgi:pentatricopeptide repeat protein